MININTQLAKKLNLVYWQLNSNSTTAEENQKFFLTHEEKELLRKILLAKNIKLNENKMEIFKDSVVIVTLNKLQLVFNDVSLNDDSNTINLAKISDMLIKPELKKYTWFKLKDLTL